MKSIVALLVIALALVASALNFPCGTYVITGGAKDQNGALYGSGDAARILAVSSGGVVLAASSISDPYGEGANARNFCLSVPLSTETSAVTARVGDTVNLVMEVNGVTNIATEAVRITQANGGTNLFVQVWDTVSYTNADNVVVRLSRRYVEEIQPWVEAYGYGVYDPFADYDGDGRSNYREYIEGTSPFDATDYLRITAYTPVSKALHAISFEYSGGRVYGISATTNLASKTWKGRSVQTTPAAAKQDQVAYEGTEESVGAATIYVVPTESVQSEFFRLDVK